MASNRTSRDASASKQASNHQVNLDRADEAEELLKGATERILPFIRAADEAATARSRGGRHGAPIVDQQKPEDLVKKLGFTPPTEGQGKAGLLQLVDKVLENSVNTWDQGFLDKLYASTNPVGLVSELVLAALNTNLHVYQVSPALTVVEKTVGRALAHLFGLDGPCAGGISMQGGSAANLTSMVVARSALYPATKAGGNGRHRFAVFTSAHAHYSIKKAALALGLGTDAVRTVRVDAAGRMDADALRAAVREARAAGSTPLYVNATAGTTVLGSFDPFEAVADVCRDEGMWLHVDASWGGPLVFSARQAHKLAGARRADSVAVNPHKMLNVPVTCSFLLGADLGRFHAANTLPAGYLFHGDEADQPPPTEDEADEEGGAHAPELWDLADMTLQCGRRGDALKLALAWTYYGGAGFGAQIDGAFDVAAHLVRLVKESGKFELVSQDPPPCLQVCFFYGRERSNGLTKEVTRRLIGRGFMVDFAPDEEGSFFFRVVVNLQTRRETVEGLVKAFEELGEEVGGETR